MISREHYDSFASKCPDLPVFLQPWWLDAAAGDGNWTPVVVLRDGVPVAVWPVPTRRKGPLAIAGMLHLTPYLGPWMYNPSMALVRELMASFPKRDVFYQNLYPGQEKFFETEGNAWDLEQHHTRCILDLQQWSECAILPRAKASLKKARKNLQICETGDPDRVWRLAKMTWIRQGLSIPFPEEVFQRIFKAAIIRKQLRAWIAYDPIQNRDHATAVIVSDSTTAYYLLGGADPEVRGGNGGSLVLFQAPLEMQKTVSRFDFLGSTIPSIDVFFENMGGLRTNVAELRQTTSRLARLGLRVRKIWKRGLM